MKVIDLLNKIANGEIEYTRLFDAQVGMGHTNINEYFERYPINANYLNCEIVEILPKREEEKKIPEKLNLDKDELLKKVIITAQDYVIEGKINEIIDYLKSKGE